MDMVGCISRSWQLMAYGLLSCSLVYSIPTDPIVVNGSASFENIDLSTLSITTSDKAVINWNDFSIDAGEVAQFFQPSSQSVAINRVTSDLSSVLLGSLKANGKIFLLNPNGILIGENASIDTSSFIASTLSANLQDLLSDTQDVLFQGSSTATITNLGTITAWDGDVYLIGYQLDNQGSIDASNGTVAIGAGQEVLLQPTALEKIVIRPSLAKYEISSSIDNSGSIAACRAELKADGNAYAMAINHTGSIDAIGIDELNGEVYLTAGNGNNGVYGTITSSNADGTGGSVQILGDHIALLNNALVDASGDMGGGTVLIGGDKSGSNPAIWNAQTTYVDKNVKILADAQRDGNGGKVITWAEGSTCFYGKISARGGENSGDGGFVEISGKLALDHRGEADRIAPNGKAGVLLLDPLDITINNMIPPDINVTSPSAFTFAPNGPGSILTWTTLTGAGGLGGGNTIVQAAAGVGGTGTILVSGLGNYTSPYSLTLDNTTTATTGNIVIDVRILNHGTGDINIYSLNDIDINIDVTTAGDLNLITAAGNGGNLNVQVLSAYNGLNCTNFNAAIDGDITFTGGGTLGYQSLVWAAGNIAVTSNTGDINFIGGTTTDTSAGLNGLNAGIISVQAPMGGLNVLSGVEGSGIIQSGSGLVDINVKNNVTVDTTAALVGSAGSQIDGRAGLTINAAALTMTAGIQGSSVQANQGNSSAMIINLTGDMTMTSLNSGVIVDAGTITLNTPGNLIITGPITGGGYCVISGYVSVDLNVNNVFSTGNLFPNIIETSDGPISILASQSVMLIDNSQIIIHNPMPMTPAPLLVRAGTDISISANSSIINQTSGPLTLVCDNDFPTPPFYGPGKFTNLGAVTTTGGPLWIFTSRRFLNTQSGLLNAVPFVPGPIYVDSTSERWYTWYNNNSNGYPYKVFYKDLPTATPVQMQTALTNFNTAAFEFLQNLQNYDVFWYWRTQFSSAYDKMEYNKFHNHEGLTSSDVFGKKIFHLLRKSYKEQNGKVVYLLQ